MMYTGGGDPVHSIGIVPAASQDVRIHEFELFFTVTTNMSLNGDKAMKSSFVCNSGWSWDSVINY
jgi:hypothetical protein